MALDGQPSIDDIDALAFINFGPSFNEFEADSFFSQEKFLGKVISMEIHESVNSMYRYGFIKFEDNVGLRERLPMTGNEIVTLLYKNKLTGTEGSFPFYKIVHFNIFNIEEDQMRPNSSKEERFQRKAFTFHLIEAPFYLKYNGQKIMRTFGKDLGTGKIIAPTIDNIFETFLRDSIKLNEDFIEYDFHKMTNDVFRVSCPFWKPQKFFKYILDYARDENDFGNVKFFTSSNLFSGLTKVNLKSMLGMFKTPNNDIVHSFSLVDKSPFDESVNIPVKGITQRNINQIFYYKFLTYDLSSLTIGLAGGTQFNYQYDGSVGYHIICDNYEQSLDRNPQFGNFAIWDKQISNEFSVGHYIGSVSPSVARNYLNNRITDHNFQIRCEALCPVNEWVQVGDAMGIQFMSANPNIFDGQANVIDEQMSGGWLIEEIIDSYQNGKAIRKMILVKDSFFDIYSSDNRNIRLPESKSVLGEGSGKLEDQIRRGGSDLNIYAEGLTRTLQELSEDAKQSGGN